MPATFIEPNAGSAAGPLSTIAPSAPGAAAPINQNVEVGATTLPNIQSPAGEPATADAPYYLLLADGVNSEHVIVLERGGSSRTILEPTQHGYGAGPGTVAYAGLATSPTSAGLVRARRHHELAQLDNDGVQLASGKISALAELTIQPVTPSNTGAAGRHVVVAPSPGADGDGATKGGVGGRLQLLSGQAGTDGGAGRGGAGHVEIAVPFTAPVTVDDGNLLLYAGPHPGALPTNGSVLLFASEGLIFQQAKTISFEATEATDESVSLSANDPLGTIRLRSGGTNALQVFDTKLEPYSVDAYDLGSSAIPFRHGYYGAGTIAAPSVRVGDDGTGLYSPGASQLGLGANNKAVIVDATNDRIALHADAVWSIGQLSTALVNVYSGIYTVATGGVEQARLHEVGLDFAHGKVGGFTIGQSGIPPVGQTASDLSCVAGTGGPTDGVSLAAPGGNAFFQSGHGGDGDGALAAADGGDAHLLAGWGGFDGGGGPGAGGDIIIDAGRGSFGTGTNGTIQIGKDYAASITSGPAAGSIPWTHNGDLTVTSGGTQRAQVTADGLRTIEGTTTVPAIAGFTSTTTGLSFTGGLLSFIVGGARKALLGTNALIPNSDLGLSLGGDSTRWTGVYVGPGSLATPAISIGASADKLGFYEYAGGNLGVSIDGVLSARWSGTAYVPGVDNARFLGVSTLRWQHGFFGPGSTGTAAVSVGAQDDGLYQPSADTLGVTVAGTERARVTTTALQPGTDGVETLGYQDDTNSGLDKRWSHVLTKELKVRSVVAQGAGITEGAGLSITTHHQEVDGSLSPVVVWSHALDFEEGVYLIAKMVGRDVSNSDNFFFVRGVRAYRNASGLGGNVLAGSTIDIVTDTENPNVDVEFAMNGTTIELRVVDAGGTLDAGFSFSIERMTLGSY